MSFIEISDLKRVYKMSKEVSVEALRGVSFEVQKGEFISVVGSSGSGKSTLLNILGGLDFEYTGKISIDGKNIKEYNPNFYRRNIVGTIFQQFYLIPSLSVEENILLPLKFVKNRNIDVNERLESLLEMVDLKNRRKHFPKELSGGQAQRVAIARALIDNPKVVLADEPTGNLDSKTGESIIRLLKELNKTESVTVILVTHDKNISAKTDRVITLVDGKNV
ncbi:MAG TPA: ABC transporter ATP-binding protein [Candidatus Dojkabacteria bacterium]|nr:ABC transporter ATP-binding protein [Candidatus Dojkabacteria bacterium]